MKKKLLLCLLLLVSFFTLVGCGNKKEEKKEEENKEEEVVDKTLVKVNGVELHINKGKEFKGIKYTTTDDLKEATFDMYVQYYLYQESGPNLLFFRIFYYENKDMSYIKNDLAIDTSLVEETGKTDNIEYTLIDTKRTDGTIHYYVVKKDNKSYVINFVSKYNIKDFEKLVLNSIKF